MEEGLLRTRPALSRSVSASGRGPDGRSPEGAGETPARNREVSGGEATVPENPEYFWRFPEYQDNPGESGRFREVPGESWKFLEVPGSSGENPGGSAWSLENPGGSKRLLKNPGCSFRIRDDQGAC
jgi:hypothetical protein